MGFLGLRMSKPILHVFVKAFLDPVSDAIVVSQPQNLDVNNADIPPLSFDTSHVLFNQLVSNEESQVQVEVLGYSVLMDGKKMLLQSLGVEKQFTLDPQPK